jgi:hypothetical protein
MQRFIAILFGVVTLVGAAATADAKIVQYRSQHPLPRKIGHGFCYIDVPHVHDFGPSDPRMYRDLNGELYFVGDPAPFDYQGPRYSFYGPHPVPEAGLQQNGQPVYCYLNGPHFHWYQPPPQAEAQFQFRGGAYWYTGNFDPSYYQERPRFAVVNQAYQPLDYTRPVVDVRVAPPAFRGEILVGPGFPHGRAELIGPGLSAGVYIAPPPPPELRVGIGLGLGGPPVIEQRREVYEVREHHERGWERHEEHGHGWRGGEEHGHGWRGGGEEHGHGWRGAEDHGHAAGGWRGSPPAAHNKPPQHGGGWRGR